MDGNFTAQHMKMRKPEEDVFLSNGLGYMVQDRSYQDHISSTADNKEVCNYSCLYYQQMYIYIC